MYRIVPGSYNPSTSAMIKKRVTLFYPTHTLHKNGSVLASYEPPSEGCCLHNQNQANGRGNTGCKRLTRLAAIMKYSNETTAAN